MGEGWGGGVFSAPGAIRFQMPRFWRHKQIVGNSEFWRRRRKFLGFLARFPMIFSHFLSYFSSKIHKFLLVCDPRIHFWRQIHSRMHDGVLTVPESISGPRSNDEHTLRFLHSQNPQRHSALTIPELVSGPNPEPVQPLCVSYRSKLCIS